MQTKLRLRITQIEEGNKAKEMRESACIALEGGCEECKLMHARSASHATPTFVSVHSF